MRRTSGHIDRPPARRRRRKAKPAPPKEPAVYRPDQVGPGGSDAAGILVSDIERLIDRALAEAEGEWRPRLESALTRVAELEAELGQERQKHARWVALTSSTTRADAEAIRVQRHTIGELQNLCDELRAKGR